MAPEIEELYPDFPQYTFDLNYTAAVKRVGTELMITSKGIRTEGLERLRPVSGGASVSISA